MEIKTILIIFEKLDLEILYPKKSNNITTTINGIQYTVTALIPKTASNSN